MYQLVLNLIKAFHIAYVVTTCFVNNPNTFGFTFSRNFLF
jgi:hypothetical protein